MGFFPQITTNDDILYLDAMNHFNSWELTKAPLNLSKVCLGDFFSTEEGVYMFKLRQCIASSKQLTFDLLIKLQNKAQDQATERWRQLMKKWQSIISTTELWAWFNADWKFYSDTGWLSFAIGNVPFFFLRHTSNEEIVLLYF